MLGLEPRVCFEEASETAHQESGASQQNQRQGYFSHHQRRTQTMVLGTLHRASPAFLERAVKVNARRGQGGSHTKDQARKCRQYQRESEHRQVQPNGMNARDIRRHQFHQYLGDPEGHAKAEGRTQAGEQHALSHPLTKQPKAPRAQSKADGNFLLAAGGAGQEQVGNIGAGDEQHETHGP